MGGRARRPSSAISTASGPAPFQKPARAASSGRTVALELTCVNVAPAPASFGVIFVSVPPYQSATTTSEPSRVIATSCGRS